MKFSQLIVLLCIALVSNVSGQDRNLEINGQIKIQGGDPGVNKVLVSDAEGLAQWSHIGPPPPSELAIGDFAYGGIVFWLSPSGEHGKVVSIYEHGLTSWSNIQNTSIGTTARSRLNGAGNSVAIINQAGHVNSAALLCADYAYAGYDDWYLPARDELISIQNNRVIIENAAVNHGGQEFVNLAFYWSSTEHRADDGIEILLKNTFGNAVAANIGSKDGPFRFRPIRAF